MPRRAGKTPWFGVLPDPVMAEKLYCEAISRFEAACHIGILPTGHRARAMHGHGYIVRLRAGTETAISPWQGAGPSELARRLDELSGKLDYGLLNDVIDVPTDENLARWFREQLQLDGIQSIGIQSTTDGGADLLGEDEVHIWRRFRFEAAHRLPHVPAGHKCGRMHGHGFEVVVHVQEGLEAGEAMGLDFDLIGPKWQVLHEQLHYHCLNDIPGLDNPTSENIAAWIWDRLKDTLPELSWISVYETKSSGCHYNGHEYRIWKEQSFESALSIASAPRQARVHRLHGHSFLVRLHLVSDLDAVMGWTLDFGEVKEKFRPTWQKIDHHRLDDIEGLEDINPAAFITWMDKELADTLPELAQIDLYETPGCGVVLCKGSEAPALPTKSL